MTDERWARVKALFQAAVERPTAERNAFLAAATAGDDALLREVESLLASDAGDVTFLDRLPAAAEAVLADSRTFPPTASGLNQSQPVLEPGDRIGSAQEPTQSFVGQQLGSYHVLSRIGEGGMGEVYRAKDTRLRRDVALKVLPKAFARDPERLARFQREAQILASLNHKNIAAIYGLEEANGVHFLVLELVEGETFAERIERQGPLPIEKALPLSQQVAEALEYAHKKAITHRDIKPANIKVTPEGEVKVLDFGVAKIFEGGRAGMDLSDLPTLGPGPTRDGQILGTPAYMSPEQVRGQEVDKRADIWAFGCVLYALLTGKQAFRGETIHDTISAVLDGEPDRQALPPSTPDSLRTLLRRCLHKDANRRLHDIADARIEIEEALATPAPAELTTATVAPARPMWRRLMPWAAASLVLSAAVGLAVRTFRPSLVPAPLSVTRATITLPAGQRLAALDQPAIAISPDGKKIVYVAIQSRDRERADPNQGQAGTQQLFLRPLESQESKPIAGTEGAVAPFFSPDSQWIGFFAGGALKKISVNGGPVVTLANTPVPGGGNWSSQGILTLQGFRLGGLQQISQEDGTPRPLTSLEKTEVMQRWPELLPGGNAVLFAASATLANWDNAQIAAQPIGGGERKNLVAGTQPRYAPTGHLLYMQSGTLMAAPFEPQRLALTGAGVPAIEGVAQSLVTGAAQYSLSSTGTLVYLAGGPAGSQTRMVWVSRNGEEPLRAAPRNYQFPRVSPDGGRVAVTISDQEAHIWVYDVARDGLTQLTFEGTVNNAPTWSPDGKRIAFRSNRAGGPGSLFWQASDNSGGAERLTTTDYTHLPNSFSTDGQLLAFQENNPQTGRDIWVLPLIDRKKQPFLRTPFQETAPKFSHDGRWLAYSSDESGGRSEVYVQPYPGPDGKRRISTEGGQEPVWNSNGRELFYRSGSKIMAAEVDTKSGFSPGTPRVLFEGTYLPSPVVLTNYDVSPDGQRFLMLKPIETQTSAPTQINVVLNWFEELKRRVPAGR